MLFKVVRNSLLVAPALLGMNLFASTAIATEAQPLSDAEALTTDVVAASASSETISGTSETIVSDQAPEASSIEFAQALTDQAAPVDQLQPAGNVTDLDAATTPLDQVMEYGTEGLGDTQEQVTSISQLSDVQPTDWAFQALQSLVERYGVIAGYPDGTYRGNRALTRYEFAAGLNAALDRVNELIAAGLADAVTREDLATLQRLQEEFSAELASIRGQVDALEARTAELEANQFSTTTKLSGRTLFLLSAPFEESSVFSDQAIFAYRVRLNFDTSFTGRDRLRARLQARNVPRFEGDSVGLRASGDSGGNFQLDNLFYTFPIGDRLSINIGANALEVSEVVDNVISRFEDNDSGAISAFGRPTQYTQAAVSGGAGANFTYQLLSNDNFKVSLSGGYIGREAASPAEGSGLFNGDYSAAGQLTLTSSFVDAAITYVNTYSSSAFTAGGIYDIDGPVVGNTYGAQVNFKLFGGDVEIGGGGAFTDVSVLDGGGYDLWSYQATLGLPDFLGEGNLLGVLAGIPPYTRDFSDQTRDTAFLTEIFYRYNLNDNIAITPSVIWLADPGNNNGTSDTFIGTLRTTFRF